MTRAPLHFTISAAGSPIDSVSWLLEYANRMIAVTILSLSLLITMVTCGPP